ncbi:MAG: hypothetical protein FVQ82_01170 [Planctomycetes bacterium]|nr:hypothetical protein [Planctomycetota bacterium]
MQLPGISTGIDTATIVQQLMTVSKQRLYTYKVQKNRYQERNTALEELRGKLSSFYDSLSSLSNFDNLTAFKATSSDKDILTATAASTGVFEGNHEIEVNQLANSERLVHSGFLLKESLVGSGKFIYSYNHEERIINTDASTTLEDLAGLINNDTNNPGVTATLLEYDNGNEGVFHLVLSGNDAGSDYQITINSSTTQVLAANAKLEKDSEDASLATKLVDLDGFTTGTYTGSEVIEITGNNYLGNAIAQKDLNFTVDMTVGHLIDRINDAYDGFAKAKFEDGRITLTDDVSGYENTTISLALTGVDVGDPISLSLPTFSIAAGDGGTKGGDYADDVTNTNISPADFLETQAAQDSLIKVDGYPASEVQTLSATTSPTLGTFTLTYGGEETANINYDATAQDIQDALELLTNVSADDITVAGTLDAGDVTFTFASSIGDASMISIDPSGLTPATASNYSVEETAKAFISRSSNSLTNVLPGVSMELYDVGTVQISLNKDTNKLKAKLRGLVNTYNSTVSFIKEKTAYDKETNTAGVLILSYTARVIQSIMRTGMRTPASGFVEGEEEYLYAWEIGLDFSDDQEKLGTISLDEAKLDEAIDNDYEAVAALLGAFNTGRSSGTDKETINFKDSSKFTQAGNYDVEVTTGADGNISSAKIKLSTETEWRDQTDWNILTGIIIMKDRLDEESEWYPERDLQISIDVGSTSPSQTYTATIHVQQGFAGALHERLDDVLDSSNGYLSIDTKSGDKAMEELDKRIEQEEKRLDRKEQRLTAKFARLEKTMTLLQQQLSALSMLQIQR